MDQVRRIVQNTVTLAGLAQIQLNASNSERLTPELQSLLNDRAIELGREYLKAQLDWPLDTLTAAEERIVRAVSAYIGLKVRGGTNANLTIRQIKNRGGLLAAAEAAVDKVRPTAGFETLTEAGLDELSYEQIILDHPEEFSSRALWNARRTLGLPNTLPKAPSKSGTPIQEQTDRLLDWLMSRRGPDRRIAPFTNAEGAAALGWPDLQVFGRAYGNLQSRLDFACYRAGLPPLGLTAEQAFARAWGVKDRDWRYPVEAMRLAANTRAWSNADFDLIRAEANALPGQAHIAWQESIATEESAVRAWAEGLAPDTAGEDNPADEASTRQDAAGSRNPVWSRDELILALELYFSLTGSAFGKTDHRILELSTVLAELAASRGVAGQSDFRNPNGVHMKLMNFRSFDPEYTSDGRVGLTRGNRLEAVLWEEFATDLVALGRAAEDIRQSIQLVPSSSAVVPYWVFVCNPKKWNIDRFLAAGIERDTWGVRPSDRQRFAPGQLGIVRVGVDQRTNAERQGKPRLDAGIYALCEVESEAFDGIGASEPYWAEGQAREPGWPTVNIRYLRSFAEAPLTIEQLKRDASELSPLLLNGFQAASFPISESDFRAVLDLLSVSVEDAAAAVPTEPVEPHDLSDLEARYQSACPEVKHRVSRTIERGPIGALVKKRNGYRCQVCEALGADPIGFRKRSGAPYVEAHHVMPVSRGQVGSLAASNILTACANHHRQLHYGDVEVRIEPSTFEITIDGRVLSLPKSAVL
ncbi:EVE domain-containing protein [Aquidulcibacter paucihalophilus]|nr:EVE domain-containing protein [Aquidulcibacter paucihalophilus]